ncbi:MAG: hypothetical protein ACT4OP_08150 [Actinomycetota bacterium]
MIPRRVRFGQRHMVASVMLVVSALIWSVMLFVDPTPWSPTAGAVLSAGLVLPAVVSAVAIMVEQSRFGYLVGLGVLGGQAAVAVGYGLGLPWVLGAAATGITGMTMADPTLGGWLRPKPGPRRRFTLAVSLLLLTSPTLAALVSGATDPGPLAWLAIGSWAVLLWYLRGVRSSLPAIRVGTVGLLAMGFLLDGPARPVFVALMAFSTVLCWNPEVRLAVRPLLDRDRRPSMPAELAEPPEWGKSR